MSKKAVKVRKSYVKQWIAVITGSLFASAMQAHAHDVDRPSFRDFRDQNPGIDRQAVRQMYRQEFGVNRASNPGALAVPTINSGANNLPVPGVSNNANGVDRIRLDRLSRRLERQGVINQSVQGGDGSLVNLRNGVSLDLGSDVRNITLGNKLFDKVLSVEINVGGETKTVAAGSQVSAAEYIAVKQILTGSSQKIVIDGKGAATGGEVDLGAITGNNDVLRATDLTVPVNVTTYGDFSKRSDFKLLGDLNNAGTVYTYGNGRNGVIRADDIVNQVGASITADSSLGLLASGNLSNYGTITSKGTLTLSAGNVLTNAGDVSAKNDVNLNAPTVNNTGSIAAVKGNINIDAPSTSELNVNAEGGAFTAGGDINVRAVDYAGTSNTNLNGGNYFSKQLNLNAGGGILRADVGELTGQVNQTGSEAHLSASTDELNIGQVCLTGDPTYKNDAGNININGNISVNQKLAIIASGNITSANNITISTSQPTGGFDIIMVAGAEQTPGGTNSTTAPGTPSGTTLTGFASSSGGSILLGSNVLIDTRGTNAGADGGNVTMYAFQGLNFNSGRVDIANTTIRTGGTGTGSNGDVGVVAGAQNTTAIRLGTIDTTGGVLETGYIYAMTAQPVSSGGAIDLDASGNITSSNGLTAVAISTSGDIIATKNITSQGGITLASGGTVTVGAGAVFTNSSSINSIFLNGLGGIVSGGNSSLLVSDRVELQTISGDVATAGNRLRVDANGLTINSPNNSAYVTDIDDLSVNGFIVGNTADIQSAGLLTVGTAFAPHTANHITLRSTGGAINIDADLVGATDVRLRASSTVTNSIGNEITSPQTYLTSDTSTVNVVLTGGNVVVNAATAVLNSTGSINFAGGASAVTGILQANSLGNLSATSNITADIVQLVTASGSLALGSVITGSTQINLSSSGSIVDASLAGSTIVSPELNLSSSNGSVGSVGNQLHIDANRLSAFALTGDVYVVDPNSVTLIDGVAATNFTVIASNNILSTAGSTVTAPNVTLTATNGSFGLAGAVYGANVSLTSGNTIASNGLGNIALDNTNAPVTNLALTSTNGSVGSLGARVATNADNLKLNALNGVYVANNSTGGSSSIASGSTAGTDFFVSTNNNFDVSNAPTAGRNIELSSTSGDLNIGGGVTLTTTGGYIKLSGATAINAFGAATASGNVILDSADDLVIGAGDFTSTAGNVIVTAVNGISALGMGTIDAFGTIDITSTAGQIQLNKSLETSTGNINLTAFQVANFYGATSTVTTPADFNITGGFAAFGGGTVDAENVTLKSTVNGINVITQLSANNSITLDSHTSIDDSTLNNSPAILVADQINLKAVSNIGLGAANPLDIDAVNLNLQGITVAVRDPNSVNINGVNTSNLEFRVTAVDDLTTSGVIGQGDFGVTPSIQTLNLTAGGSMQIGANMFGQTVQLSSGTDMTTVNGAQVRGFFLALGSANGDIGTDASSRFNTKSTTLTVNTGGSAFILADAIPSFLGLSLTGNSVITGTFDLARPDADMKFGNVTVDAGATLTATNILLSAPRGFITLTGTTTGTNSVTLSSAGSILNSNVPGLAFTDTLSLKTTIGDVGSLGDLFVVNANNFNASAGILNAAAGVFATRTGALNVVGSNFAGSGFNVAATGALNVTGSISAVSVNLNSSGAKVQIPGSITSSVLSISSGNGIVDADLSGTINVQSANLTTTAGAINLTALDVNTLSFNSAGTMTFVDPNSLTINLSSTAVSNISITAAQNLSSTALISSTSGSVALTATNGSFDLDGGVRASASISLASNGDINNTTVSGALDGGVGQPVNALVLQTAGDIGASGGQSNAFSFNALNVAASAENAYLNNTGTAINLNTSTATGDLALWSVGNISIPAGQTVSADSLYLNSSTGSILIPGAVSVGSKIEFVSFNDILTANFASPLSAPTIILNATNSGATVNVTANFQNVSASATTVVLTDTVGSMNIGPGSSAATSFTATAPMNITNDGTITADTVNLTATAGGFTFNNAITGSTSITLTSGDDILNGVGLGQLITPTLVATSTGGDIGTALDPLTLNVDNVTLNAALGNVWVNNADDINVIGASSAQGVFSLHANGVVLVSSTIDAAEVELKALGGSADYVQLLAAVTGTTSVTVSSDGGIFNSDGIGNIVSPRINLITTQGAIGLENDFLILDTNVLSVQSAAGAYIQDSNSVDLAASSAAGGFSVIAANNLTSSGTVSGQVVSLTATGGSLTLNGLVSGSQQINLTSQGSIFNSSIAGGLDLGTGIKWLNLTSTGGDIGAALDFLQVDVDVITANAATGSVFVQDPNAMKFGVNGSAASNAAGEVFYAIAGGALSSIGPVSGNAVRLVSGDKFDLDGAVTATTQIRLDAQNSILNADISGGLNSPDLYLTSVAGTIGEATDFLTVSASTAALSASGVNGSVYFGSTVALTLQTIANASNTFLAASNQQLTVNTAVTGADVDLEGANGLALNANVTGTNSVQLISGAGLTQSAGTVAGGALNVEFISGPVTLATNVVSLTADGGNQGLTINERDGITLSGISAGVFSLIASQFANGNVLVDGDIDGTVVSLLNNGGNITIDADVIATTSLTLNTSGGTGYIQQPSGTLTTPVLTALAAGGGIGGVAGAGDELVFTNGANPVSLTATSTGGNVSLIHGGTGVVNVQASSGNGSFSLVSAGGSVTLAGNISGTGTLSVLTNNLTNNATANFDQIHIENSPVGALSISGGTFTTANGFTADSSHGINLSGTILLNGTGEATFTVGDEPDQFVVNTGAIVTGANRLTVNACDLVFNGTITGNPLVIVCSNNGTIANSLGDVVLPSDLVFVGQNLAILAAGNITTTGSTSINLSGPSNGGSLTLMAGYNFTPATAGQIQGPGLYTITGVNADGGSIDLTGVTLNLNGASGNGGNFSAVANAGALNDGSIVLHTINATGTVNGGSVNIIGPGGVSVGNINTLGGSTSGNVNVSVAAPTIVGGPITVQNGVLLTGSFGVGAQTAGDLSYSSINAGAANVTLRGALGSTDAISQTVGGTISANTLSLIIGDGTAGAKGDVISLNASSTGAGTVNVTDTNALTLGTLTGAGLVANVAAGGTLTVSTAFNIAVADLTTTAGDIVLNAAVGGSNSVSLESAGTITQTAGTIGGGTLFLDFVTGPVTLSSDVARLSTASNAVTLTINEANALVLGSQGVDVLNVNIANGNVTTDSDFTVGTLSLNLVNGAVTVSNSIGATGTTTVSADDEITTTGSGVINGATVLLDTNANLGVDAANRLQINATTFQVSADNAFVNDQNTAASTLNASTAIGTLDVSTAGDLVSGGNYSAAVVALATGGAFDLTSTISGTTSVSLTTDGDLTNITGTLNTPTLLLNSVNGNVGTDASNPFLVAANVTSIGGTAGDGFFVSSAATGGVNFVGITAGGDIDLKANGGLSLTQDITSTNGAFSVTAQQDTLDIADGITILAHDEINITMVGSTKKRDSIVFGNGSSVITNAKTAGLGNVNIILGTPQSPGRKTPTPKKYVTVVENGGSVLFGGKKAQAVSGGIVFTAQGADVYVSTFNPKSIVFEGNNIITADPPVAEGTPMTVRTFGNGHLAESALGVLPSVNNSLSSESVNGSLTMSPLAVSNPSATFAVNNEMRAMQLVSLNNATSSILENGTMCLGSAATNRGALATGGLSISADNDDSYISTSAPATTFVDAKFCSDIELGSDTAMSSVNRFAHSQCVTLDNGSVLFAPKSDTTVVTPKGTVKVAANSVAMIVVDNNHLSVYDVNDLHKRSVVVEAGGRSIPLSPGKHAVITHAGIQQFAEINPIEAVMHRGFANHELGNGHKAFTSEFSVPSAIQSIKPLAAIVQSEHRVARKVRDGVLKTTAVIMQMTSNGPAYELHTKPRTVALQW